jgi:hypothetical protein
MSEERMGPLTREEYERRHKALRQSYETFARRVYKVLAIIVAGLVLNAAAGTYLFAENDGRSQDIEDLAKEAGEFSTELSDALVENCEDSGNPLRAAVRKFGDTLIGQIRTSQTQSDTFEQSGLYTKLFPNVTPGEIDQLLEASRQKNLITIEGLQGAINEVVGVDCGTKYPTK